MIHRVRAGLIFAAALTGYAFGLLLAVLLVTTPFSLLISGGDVELVRDILAMPPDHWEGILLSSTTLFITPLLVAAALPIWGRPDAEGPPTARKERSPGTSFALTPVAAGVQRGHD